MDANGEPVGAPYQYEPEKGIGNDRPEKAESICEKKGNDREQGKEDQVECEGKRRTFAERFLQMIFRYGRRRLNAGT